MHLNKIKIKFNIRTLGLAIEKENVDMVKLLLKNNEIDVNVPCILIHIFHVI